MKQDGCNPVTTRNYECINRIKSVWEKQSENGREHLSFNVMHTKRYHYHLLNLSIRIPCKRKCVRDERWIVMHFIRNEHTSECHWNQ